MGQLAIARRALEDEVVALKAEVHRLENVLAAIEPSVSAQKAVGIAIKPEVVASVETAKPAGTELGNASPLGALEIIKAAGRGGIKALALASQLKKAGQDRPSKDELLASGKIKVSGKGGGTTYTFKG